MKILQIFKIYWPDNGGGIASAMEAAASFFPSRDQKIIVCHEKPRKRHSSDEFNGVKIIRCRHFGFQPCPVSPDYIRTVRRELKACDVVISHYPYPLSDIAFLKKKAGEKRIIWWHCDVKKKIGLFYHPLVRRSLKDADLIIVGSKNNIRHSPLLRRYKNKCAVIPYAVSGVIEDAAREYEAYPCVKKREGDRIDFLFTGRMVWYKGVDVLLQAFKCMHYENKTLTLVGGGPELTHWRETAKALGIKNVRFTGKISEEEKAREYEKCDIFVLPSTTDAEAFGIVQIEAMRFGKPVINTELPTGVPEVSRNMETGLTVPPGDVNALADAMDRLCMDADLRETLGKTAGEKARKKYTPESMRRSFVKALRMTEV